MPQARDLNGNVVNGVFDNYGFGRGQLVAYTGTAGVLAGAIGTPQGVITSDATAPADGDTVVIGSKTYAFKTSLTPAEGEVLINTTAAAALLNLIRAINHSGTPNTDYKCAAVNADVTADVAVTSSTHFRVYAKLPAVSVATTTPIGTHQTWGSTTLTGGRRTDTVLVQAMITTAGYVRFGAAPTATTSDIPMAAGVPQVFALSPGMTMSAVQSASGGNLTAIEVL